MENEKVDPHHIPGGTDRDVLFGRLPNNPDHLLQESLFPEDAYVGETYWADLPAAQRTKWINKQNTDEMAREFGIVWAMFKSDPLKPFSVYFHNYVITGLGFFTEGYTLFSVGNIITLFEVVWATCFETYKVCNKVWVQSINYLEIVGIICGQIMIGILGDWIGRRWGIIQDAMTMLLGTVMLTAMWGTSQEGWVICYALSLLVFGVGVGGEYPMTAITSMEGVHGEQTSRNDKLHRGRGVLLAFLMQGWGQLANQVVLIILLLVFHSGPSPPFGKSASQWTFRLSFAFIAVFLLWLVYIRVFKLKNVDATSKASKQRQNVTGYDVASLKLTMRHYWHRLLATSLCWFCNDFPFYGNQIFRSTFTKLAVKSSDEVIGIWLYNLVNVGCELVGYHLAALLIDHKGYGRRKMQAVGFMMSFILFIIAACLFPQLNVKGTGAHAFEAIYFVSSFFIQFGPNSTTFLLAGEVYPAPVRATAHGVSAAVGKLGALTATVLYNYIGSRTKFWVVSWFGLIGFMLTIIFIPDTTGLDLREQERYWIFVREGRAQDYHGIAVHPRHLSLFERWVLKRDRAYDPELDREAKKAELRGLWQAMGASSGKEELDASTLTGQNTVSDKVSAYFQWEKTNGKGDQPGLINRGGGLEETHPRESDSTR